MISRSKLRWVLAGLALFILWTVVSRMMLANGRENSVWRAQPFGIWPSSFGSADGHGQDIVSIRAVVDTQAGEATSVPQTLGPLGAGQATDSGGLNSLTASP